LGIALQQFRETMLPDYEIEIRVRYYETDAQGFVHHANYFVYFE
jgi:acyl-CoA thioester hydrolase